MALIFMDGYDAGDLTTKWTLVNNVSPSTAQTRFGTGRSVYIANYFWFIYKILPIALPKIFVGFAFKNAAGSPGRVYLSLWGDSANTCHLRLETASDVALRVVRGDGTVLATSANGTHTANVWEYIEMMATIADTGGRAVVRVNGVTVIDYTGDTKNAGTASSIDTIRFGSTGGNNGPVVDTYFDDVYVADDTGSVNNNFLGDVRVQTLVPMGPGTDTQLTPTGVANNWDNVNELPVSLTDYNSSSTVGQRDTYAMQDLPSSTGTVFAVQPNYVIAKTDAGTANFKPVIRTNGTLYYDPTTAPSSTATVLSLPHDTDPNTSSPWTAAGVNSMETGIEIS